MNHFVCSGCCGVSPVMKSCETAGCSKEHEPSIECSCTDNLHEGICLACKDCGKLCTLEGGCQIEVAKPELPAGE